MVRFNPPERRRPRNYLARREQWRLLLLIVPLGLVIIVMGRLRDPKTAEQINALFVPAGAQAEASTPTENGPTTPSPSPVRQQNLTPESFRSNGASEPVPHSSREISNSPRRASGAGAFASIDPQLLASIQDNTYFRNSEQDAWFHFLGTMQRLPADEISAAHSIEANYVQLVDQPDFYRGKLVKVYGYVRQVSEQMPAKNDLGIDKYYRIVVQPTDGSYWPIFVYCLELPRELGLGESATGGHMKVTGLFFKKLSYRWQDGLGTAPVIVAKSIDYHGAQPCGPGMADIHPPIEGATTFNEGRPTVATTPTVPADQTESQSSSFRDILDIAGWSIARLAAFDDGRPLTDEQRKSALELLRRLRSFGSGNLADWVHNELAPSDVHKHPDDYRGQLVRLVGRVTKVTPHKLIAADAQRLEMPEYFECEVMLNGMAGATSILTTRVPKQWLITTKLNEPVSANALYLKKTGDGESRDSIWLAKELAWHPGAPSGPDAELFGPGINEVYGDRPDPLLGKSILGNFGMDVGQLDLVQPRGRIRAEEREAFYQMLAAAGKTSPHTLVQLATTNLAGVREYWKDRLATETDEPRRMLAHEALNRAKNGRYSAAALFNDPQSQIGQLVVVDGAARRVVRVEVGAPSDGDGFSETVRSFGLDHYYEMEVFTDDSQNYPLVFCLRELPKGFPTGESIHVPVRVAGFFFKDWLYHTRGGGGAEGRGLLDPAQYAPLLIGNSPLVIAEEKGSGIGRWIGGGLFVLALGAIWATAAWFARGDRQFRERTRAASYSLPPGTSLDNLHMPEADRAGNFPPPSEPGMNNLS
jgi:hypothetical protein